MLWKSEVSELPLFEFDFEYFGPRVDVYKSDKGVAISPNFANPDCVEHFSDILGNNQKVSEDLSTHLLRYLNEDEIDETYPLEYQLFNHGFYQDKGTFIVQDGFLNRGLYWDSAASGVLNKYLAHDGGLKCLVDLFKENNHINAVPMRSDLEFDSRPLLVFTPESILENTYVKFAEYKVLLHNKYQVV